MTYHSLFEVRLLTLANRKERRINSEVVKAKPSQEDGKRARATFPCPCKRKSQGTMGLATEFNSLWEKGFLWYHNPAAFFSMFCLIFNIIF